MILAKRDARAIRFTAICQIVGHTDLLRGHQRNKWNDDALGPLAPDLLYKTLVCCDIPADRSVGTSIQREGAVRRPSDTLNREPKRDPISGASMTDDYNPGTRVGEENITKAGRDGVGRR